MPSNDQAMLQQRVTYSALTTIFLSVFTAFQFFQRKKGRENVELKPFDLVQLGLATYRLGRMVSYDRVFELYRSPVTETVPDPSGAGETVEAKGEGIQHALGDLVCCPICTGTWIAAGLVYGLNLAPRATRTLLGIMSTVGAAELLNAATEYLQWNGQAAREEAGSRRKEKEESAGSIEGESIERLYGRW